jgi:hypothetical protein
MVEMHKVLLPRTAWFLFLLIPLTVIGFYPSYFSKILTPLPSLFHIHTFFLIIWIGLSLVQPFLIQKKNLAIHRILGRLSYVIMPIVLLTIYLMIRHSYYEEFARLSSDEIREKYNLTSVEISRYAAAHEIKALVAMTWLATFYALSIINRKNVVAHATYMVAAILVLVGPALDRIIFPIFGRFHLPSTIPEYTTFSVVAAFLVALLIYQNRNGFSTRPIILVLALHAIGVLVYALMPETKAWQTFVEFLVW